MKNLLGNTIQGYKKICTTKVSYNSIFQQTFSSSLVFQDVITDQKFIIDEREYII